MNPTLSTNSDGSTGLSSQIDGNEFLCQGDPDHWMPMQLDETLWKFKIFKAALENATGQRIKRLHSDNGREYTGLQFKAYLNHCDIKHEETVPYTPQQNGLLSS
ncbi:Rve domain containing hypothetical protein [Phytophthora palmivora]|uniref:Integrase catalytic domain-containing protein n=1 Tax=Phytophthora palmivora TaxID=4796 RepID=A0A2P4WZ13_9STRA|nr:Rve domain containing hypothetical protein [Phytophthora palmivora]